MFFIKKKSLFVPVQIILQFSKCTVNLSNIFFFIFIILTILRTPNNESRYESGIDDNTIFAAVKWDFVGRSPSSSVSPPPSVTKQNIPTGYNIIIFRYNNRRRK